MRIMRGWWSGALRICDQYRDKRGVLFSPIALYASLSRRPQRVRTKQMDRRIKHADRPEGRIKLKESRPDGTGRTVEIWCAQADVPVIMETLCSGKPSHRLLKTLKRIPWGLIKLVLSLVLSLLTQDLS